MGLDCSRMTFILVVVTSLRIARLGLDDIG